ncbi:UDP-N-acetylmuramoyl-tripeptide--D-alanyl-D-alanine ligase [Aquicoccus porphyridii]|uniref:UDP-N-acetylmuramoyl-tripeptide--D-alanyl-D-alanine ligase n=1 Tax=Aquicoccus porphyridii TaxID=1852029 RepID=A0A5A9ZSR2_9RHOB|nr:UDP-N-acetylmuramoyl-tripeptide--D-alanyl-D-alanine ligase [Aquicoccus porphyridii]KAA0920314.1 UDP-N-acetylmuramoyl-tripeptide--D-alanyl-D-alanine ligase [Aquicoccus porphyridii]RAI54891.1 UDP-N-acetylmuramoyl-tripeptide--D-alanyl-D-alanine ligase [Rhodobacteraceae bacterium AsT-22]
MTLWTAQEAAAATGGRAQGDWAARGVSIDTRSLQSGDLFVALRDVRDGHDFVAEALAKGAGAAMVSRSPEGVGADAPLLIVDEVLPALEALGRAARARSAARVVAVTGSVGKTSAKEMLRDVLQGQGRTHAAEASFNNHWGVPLTLARMPADTEFAVIEIGMNHPGEIAPLARMARPHVALITTVAPAHLEAFDSIEGIAREKAAIMDGLEPEGVAVLNADIGTAAILQDKAREIGARMVLFGETSGDYRLESVRLSDERTVCEARAHGASLLYKISSPGRHFAMNGLGVLAAAEALGADLGIAASDLARWQPPAGRGRRERIVLDAGVGAELSLIDDAFNANPTSMAAALEVLSVATPGDARRGRRVAILGDMLELGPSEIEDHAALATLDAMATVDVVHCVGPRMRHLYEALEPARRGLWVETAQELVEQLRKLLHAGDVVLVKGSKGIKVSRVVDAIRELGHRTRLNKGNA